jgi:putative ATP-dependent endonuclease of OLD family
MRIESLHVRNFRCFDSLDLVLNDRVTLLVGENNVGKSAVLDAIALVLGFRREGGSIEESDFQTGAAGADIRSAPAVRIDVVIVPRTGRTFRAGALGKLIPSLDTQLRETVRLSLTAVYDHDPAVRDIIAKLQRVDPDGTSPQEEFPRFPLRDRLPARVYAVARDFEQGTGSRASDWHKLIGEARPDPHVLEAVSKRLKSAGAYLVRETPPLNELAAALSPALASSGLLPGAKVSFTVASSDPEELFRQLDLRIRSDGSPRDLPPTKQGLGSQNMVLFALYEMYASKVLKANDPGAPSPVLLVEEPESHLHPAAVRALAARVKSLPGQVIATTHSPEFARAFEASDVTMLHRSGTARRSARCSKDVSRALKEHPNAIFAHCIVVVEGEGEESVLPVFAEALGIDLHGRGVEILNAHGQERILELWRCFGPRGLDLPMVCVADADNEAPLERSCEPPRETPFRRSSLS